MKTRPPHTPARALTRKLRTPLLFACLVWLGAIGVGLFALVHGLERWLSPWARGLRSPDAFAGF